MKEKNSPKNNILFYKLCMAYSNKFNQALLAIDCTVHSAELFQLQHLFLKVTSNYLLFMKPWGATKKDLR